MVIGMSSGKLEGNYLKNVEDGFRYDESVIVTNFNLQKSIISELKFNNNNFAKANNNILKQINDSVKENHLNTIKEIHHILKSDNNLTQNQKFTFCNSQRFFMKLYLKRICRDI
jgi:hypothetical protein